VKKVQILLSTYNGEKYLKEQLDSLLNLNYNNISILIRDDGSVDNTINILKEYSNLYSKISYYQGNNIGVVNSFFDLIKHADISADYFAFSDQDDIWKKDKISRAIDILEQQEQGKALLYCGRTILVDSNLKPIVSNIKRQDVRPSFGNALIENICIGCTSVVNKLLLQLVMGHIPEYTVMHDWWFYLTASCYGKVYFDNDSFILYRQHNNNVLGSRATYFEEFKVRLRNYKRNRGKISRQIAEFNRLYNLDEGSKKLINYVIHAKKNQWYRLKIFFSNIIYRQRKVDNIIFKILFITGKV